MKTWWKNKSLSEQRLLMLLAFVLALTGIVYGVITPLNSLIARQQQSLKSVKAERIWLDEQTRAAGIIAAVPDKTPLSNVVQQSAKAASLAVMVKEEGTAQVIVTGENIPLASVIKWLESLRDQKGIYPLKLAFSVSEKDSSLITLQTLHLAKAG
ncbi:type II secretion system protein GspM [Trabulsiella odontotermitis]|uniref:type II secretion system protein GspM n=1 Tax=Trabulsiella odontotermitis TaxID=379893 RepID=UPI0006BA62BC|nr:type II secretion system protein GspM [Trabulsiella odontotermitis]